MKRDLEFKFNSKKIINFIYNRLNNFSNYLPVSKPFVFWNTLFLLLNKASSIDGVPARFPEAMVCETNESARYLFMSDNPYKLTEILKQCDFNISFSHEFTRSIVKNLTKLCGIDFADGIYHHEVLDMPINENCMGKIFACENTLKNMTQALYCVTQKIDQSCFDSNRQSSFALSLFFSLLILVCIGIVYKTCVMDEESIRLMEEKRIVYLRRKEISQTLQFPRAIINLIQEYDGLSPFPNTIPKVEIKITRPLSPPTPHIINDTFVFEENDERRPNKCRQLSKFFFSLFRRNNNPEYLPGQILTVRQVVAPESESKGNLTSPRRRIPELNSPDYSRKSQ